MATRKVLPLVLIPAAMFIVLSWLLATAAPSANAAPALHESASPPAPISPQAPASTVRYVSPTGDDSGTCTSATSPCRTVQYAVDQAASGDEIHIATGTYTDIHVRNSTDQVVYISKTVTLRGGYSADFDAWDPAQYPTTLDARSAGRVLYISGDITPTVEGLTLINGYAGAGGGVYLYHSNATLTGNTISGNTAFNYGGGLYLWYSDATLMNNTISGNNAWDGGGLYLYHSDATLTGNTISSNTATQSGGGLYLHYSNATLTGNTISSNTATYHDGGGLYLYYSNATLTDNTISGNTATDYDGGGLYLEGSDATLTNNTIVSNTAGYTGGGLYLGGSDATLAGNTIVSNTATQSGGGLYLLISDADLQNDIVADNAAGNDGGGLYIEGSSPVMRHLTLARNSGSAGIYITEYSRTPSRLVLTDTILVSHTVGISVTTGNTATLQATLWGSGAWANGIDYGGAGTIITGTVNVRGDPAFVNPDAGDYHILPTSAAVDAGVDIGITTDIDGDPRPVALGYDIGADEALNGPALQPAKESDGQFYNPGETVTYTIRVPNDGAATALSVRITDTLPATQRPQSVAASPSSLACTVDSAWGGTVACGPTEIPAGSTVLITLTAQVTTTLSGDTALPMDNHLEVQGSNAAAVETALRLYLHNCHVRLNDDTTEYHSVQQAVDAATDGDLLKVAGLCADVHARNGVSQVAYLSKTVTLRGGYSTDFGAWDPAQHTNTLDARGAGRVLYITGDISPTVEGLTLINGNAAGLGGLSWLGDAGGGVYVITATATISACRISGNTSPDDGGGLYLWNSDATLMGNTISGNTAFDYGGGVSLDSSDATLTGNTISGNSGGGLELWSSDAMLMGNQISGNTGSGLQLMSSDATLTDNTISDNTAAYNGGGLYLWNSDATLTGNTIVSNTATQSGGGLYLLSSDADLQNDIVADNVARNGGGLYIGGSSPVLRHLTLARNGGSSGIYVTEYDDWMRDTCYSHPVLTDTILVSHTVGINVTTGNTATLQATLWGSGAWANGIDWGGAGTITTGTVNVWGDPAFVDPDAGNYRIQPPSAAVDAGVAAGVTIDIDGDARPCGNGYDIGADEYVRHPLTTVTINGPTSGAIDIPYTFAAVIPPDDGTPPITYTWMPSPQDGQGTETATYTWATTGTHTITITAENYGGVATATHTIVLAQKHALYLPLVLRGQ